MIIHDFFVGIVKCGNFKFGHIFFCKILIFEYKNVKYKTR